jgi:hypothetical protein
MSSSNISSGKFILYGMKIWKKLLME